MPYIGRAPSSGIRSRFIYTATASQTTFTGADGNGKTLGYTDGEYVDVYLNGVLLDPADYTATSKTSVVLDSGATVSDIVEIVVYDTFSVFNGTFTGDLTVDGDTLFVDSTNNRVGIGTTSPSDGQLHIKGTDTTNQVIIENTDDGSGAAPDLTLRRTSASPADDDGCGEINFQSLNDNSENLTMGTIRAFVTDVSDGTEDGAITFRTRLAGSLGERMRIEGDLVGIGTSAPVRKLHVHESGSGDASYIHLTNNNTGATTTDGFSIFQSGANGRVTLIQRENEAIVFSTNAAEKARLLADGKFLVAKTSSDSGTAGVELRDNGQIVATLDGGGCAVLNRLSTDGNIIKFLKDGSTDGQINVVSDDIAIGTGSTGLRFGSNSYLPHNMTSNGLRDNAIAIGSSSYRYDDAFITNGVTTGSDQNEKQQILSLTDAEIAAAKRISSGFKTFKWNEAVTAKGDNARTHTGVIAQEVRSALEAEGLDAGNYAFFMSDTWWEHLVDVPAVEADEENGIEAQDAYTRVDAYYTADEAPEGSTQKTRFGHPLS